ncbi:DUF4920 domain-containing protein [Adhaeribacter pallidiroseus]|uniref:DUF4920 domain-containing protein n=1 Tax=Adhaeribacter pallidiroseus TaxID=2072847 RepID=A0A369QNA7_9BACT|nr:DUF4920 domain-containing protein [Adhaeribacter pallidiroseus]RDC65165.1 hypothetical protein AHMF7616_03795 [Adhaeribacter pallidiroseus]
MKPALFLFALLFSASGCLLPATAQITSPVKDKTAQLKQFGRPVSATTVIPAAQLPLVLAGKDSVQAKVAGVVQDVCQVKGCWMDVKLTNDTRMKVRFRDYGFFVPKNLNGKEVVFEGTAYQEVISVADQQHYMKDAGKSPAEIKAIVQPKKEITFVADGVQVR